jgi:hypothetical protein
MMVIALLTAFLAAVPAVTTSAPTIDPALGTGSGSLCVLAPEQQKAFANLFIPAKSSSATHKTVRRRLSASSTEIRQQVTFAESARWNGLRLLSAEHRSVTNEESEGMEERTLVVGAAPSMLRQMLRARGIVIPLAPAFLRIDVEPYGGAAQIKPAQGGAALSCAWDA